MLIKMIRALGTGIFILPDGEEFTSTSKVYVDGIERDDVIISKNSVDVYDVTDKTIVEAEL